MYQKNVEEVLSIYDCDEKQGLTSSQVEESRKTHGENVLEAKKKKPLILKFLLEFKDPLIIILIIAAVISIIVDPSEIIESIIIFVVVILNAILGLVQENNAEKSLEALKKMSSPSSKVLRDGHVILVPSSQIVEGDIIVVEAGDFVPTDARIISCSELKVDESAFTGESVPAEKNNLTIDHECSVNDRKNMLYSATYVTNGKANAIVTAIGMKTEIGRIADALQSEDNTTTPLQHRLAQVSKIIGIISIFICIVVFFMEWLSSANIDGEAALNAFKSSVALAVAAIPEGLATVVTIVLSIGVKKMSEKNAIVKKLPAVETLGSCSIVCSDKTGTLTQNRMTVTNLYLQNNKDIKDLTKEEKEMISYFAACCDAKIEVENGEEKRIGDPTELALLDVAIKNNIDYKFEKVLDLPFDSDRKLMSVVLKVEDYYLEVTKGAPDVIFTICDNKKDAEKGRTENENMASSALRVLALAIKKFDKIPTKEDLEKDMTFVGLVGMIDPPREEVKDAISIAQKAGMKVIMITGDHITTASAIARDLGIFDPSTHKAITSKELDNISDEELFDTIDNYRVYARVAPKDKVRIVETFQRKGAIVAMTGDGVNDAPALKKADIGCAMGITGTDVSKEAADMILTDDNFSTIIVAVKQGRGIYSNIRKCVKYLLSSNIGEVITIFLASFISLVSPWKLGVPLLPIHLLFINLITDSLPAFGLGMEEPEDEVMLQKPRKKEESFFAQKLGLKIALEGVMIGLLTLSAYIIGFRESAIRGQTMAFMTLAMCQLFHAFNVKSDHSLFHMSTFKNKFLNFSFIIGFVIQVAIIYVPFLNQLFKLEALDIVNFVICIGLSLVTVLVMEVSKFVSKKTKKDNN